MTVALLKTSKRMVHLPFAKVKKQPALRRHSESLVIINCWKSSVEVVRAWFIAPGKRVSLI